METDTPLSSSSEPRVDSLQQQLRFLRTLFMATVLTLIILSGSLNVYLLRQLGYLRKDLETVRPQVAQLVAEYQKNSEPLIKNFVGALQNYARTHPDINPILAKYNMLPQGAAPVATTPAQQGAQPAATPPKKQ